MGSFETLACMSVYIPRVATCNRYFAIFPPICNGTWFGECEKLKYVFRPSLQLSTMEHVEAKTMNKFQILVVFLLFIN